MGVVSLVGERFEVVLEERQAKRILHRGYVAVPRDPLLFHDAAELGSSLRVVTQLDENCVGPIGVSAGRVAAPGVVTGSTFGEFAPRDGPAHQVLATTGEAQSLAGLGLEPEHPLRELVRASELAGNGHTADVERHRIPSVQLVEHGDGALGTRFGHSPGGLAN